LVAVIFKVPPQSARTVIGKSVARYAIELDESMRRLVISATLLRLPVMRRVLGADAWDPRHALTS